MRRKRKCGPMWVKIQKRKKETVAKCVRDVVFIFALATSILTLVISASGASMTTSLLVGNVELTCATMSVLLLALTCAMIASKRYVIYTPTHQHVMMLIIFFFFFQGEDGKLSSDSDVSVKDRHSDEDCSPTQTLLASPILAAKKKKKNASVRPRPFSTDTLLPVTPAQIPAQTLAQSLAHHPVFNKVNSIF